MVTCPGNDGILVLFFRVDDADFGEVCKREILTSTGYEKLICSIVRGVYRAEVLAAEIAL